MKCGSERQGANPRKVAEFSNSGPVLALGQVCEAKQGWEEIPGWPVGNKID